MAISLHDVHKSFDDFKAVDGVSLEVPEGSLSALLGPSGSGKSTLLRLIAGLEQPDQGEIVIGGDPAHGVPPQRRGIGFVFQHYAAFKHMTVRDNVAFGLTVRRRPKDEIRDRVDELLGIVGLSGYADRYPSQLSGGQRQRMALARALAVQPRVLLLDEPFGALDANVRAELRTWLRGLHDDLGVTTLIVTHDQEEAMEVADQVVIMRAGRVEQIGAPREVYRNPANDWVMGFLGPVSRIGDTLVRPHEVALALEPEGDAVEAMVSRVVHLGSQVRVELELAGGGQAHAQLTPEKADELELERADIVYLKHAQAAVALSA
ncbi:MAG TPA: sulfate ABC transporter ATP-binding protein [Solirubrobacteraceae bacterium]|nr:sulfate ABC transporter ATP-binding protein [Solirubrobacteraceae bacterium]